MSEAVQIQKHVDYLCQLFRQAPNNQEAHRRSAPVLVEMAADSRYVTAVLEQHLQKPGSLNTSSFPTLAFEIVKNPYFVLVLNCFLPSPTGETDITINSMHHHGDMLLTTVTTFGPGYEHWRFSPPQIVDPEREIFATRLIDRAVHPPGDVAFVDTRVMHAVMYPRSLSITFALWSSKNRVSWSDHVKRVTILKGREEWLRDLGRRLGLSRMLDLKVINYFDFYPTAEGLKGMRERVQFEMGPNRDYLPSLFHIIQRTENDALVPLVEATLASGHSVDNPDTVRHLLGDLRRGAHIPCKISEGLHFGVSHMNFRARDIESLLGPCPRRQPAVATD